MPGATRSTNVPSDVELSLATPTVEAVAMLALALAVSVNAAPYVPDGRGGVAAGPALTLAMLGVLLAQHLYPRWATLFALSPTMPEWDAARVRWIVLLSAAVVALAVATLDPARRRRALPVTGAGRRNA